MNRIDLRSDTITQPTAGMRRAMAEAEVGDDVFGDDPTINALQERMADILGKEAAIFVPSGTMANQIALRLHTRPGDQIICEAGSHIYHYEQGGPAALSGLLVRCVEGDRGALDWQTIAPNINPDDDHAARPSLITLENTHNRAGGCVLPQDKVVEVGERAHALGLALHLDGARLWNAHIASGMSLARLSEPSDTVSVCFSKGMGAPVGSVLGGNRDSIKAARRIRKLFGGGMRQAGILAAACLYALDNHLPRLELDHEHARVLSAGVKNPAIVLDHDVETNIVIFRVADPDRLLDHLRKNDILGVPFGHQRVRLVTHLMIDAPDIERTLAVLNDYVEEIP